MAIAIDKFMCQRAMGIVNVTCPKSTSCISKDQGKSHDHVTGSNWSVSCSRSISANCKSVAFRSPTHRDTIGPSWGDFSNLFRESREPRCSFEIKFLESLQLSNIIRQRLDSYCSVEIQFNQASEISNPFGKSWQLLCVIKEQSLKSL